MSEENQENQGIGKSQPGSKKKKNQDEFPLQEYRLVPVEEWDDQERSIRELDFAELAMHLWDNRKVVYRFVVIGLMMGLIVGFLTPVEYQSSATLMPELKSENTTGAAGLLERYGGLIGLGGEGMSSGNNAIRVDLYPQIVSSLPFQIELMNQEMYFSDYDTTATVFEYFDNIYSPNIPIYIAEYAVGLPWKIKNALFKKEPVINQDTSIISLTKKQEKVIEKMRERINVSLNQDNGIITVSAKMPEAKVAALITRQSISQLTSYLIDYKLEKARMDLEFVDIQLKEAKEEFETRQIALAEYRDSNRGNLTAKAQTQEQRLNSEYDLAFNVYNTLAQQYEEAKLRVQEETPLFKVLQPVYVPVDKSKPKRGTILLAFLMLSTFISVLSLIINFLRK
ncbi:MAG: Wzz/FepE/Etk N-terminal domain-containing protein [Balneolaceae bacterium]